MIACMRNEIGCYFYREGGECVRLDYCSHKGIDPQGNQETETKNLDPTLPHALDRRGTTDDDLDDWFDSDYQLHDLD